MKIEIADSTRWRETLPGGFDKRDRTFLDVHNWWVFPL
jgi:hypothetical protein